MKRTIRNILIYILFVLTLAIFLNSCKKKDDTPEPEKQWLLTIDFKNDFINPKLQAIVFISDAKGNLLADTLVSGNPRLVLNAKKNTALPFQVTIAKWEPDMHNFLVTINTYLDVMPGEWTIRGQRLVSTGDATINLQNIPAHSGPILYSNSGYSNLTFVTTGNIQPIYQTPDDLYVSISTASGKLFKWTNGITPGGIFDVDLAGMETAALQTISFPFLAQDFHVKIFGYRDSTNLAVLPVITDEQIGNGDKTDSVSVGYPASVFDVFRSSVELTESWTSPFTFTYSKYGSIPESFLKINAAIAEVNIEGSHVAFKNSGTFTVTSARWSFFDAQNLAFDWTVSGSDTLTTMALPSLSSAMKSMFPSLSLDSLHLYQVELDYFPAINSYSSYLGKIFRQDGQGARDKLEVSSVILHTDMIR